ncbi:MAG: flagellar biosynthetic protein FliO [Defluviitaleaceae bacterium]|nr:flagellar biosynthetic protein FliO [Defluviitaleaceae bacterium]MCL2275238.1 flagellar biosynthetic protein FliO [Defluviitaleaceae bacterium]
MLFPTDGTIGGGGVLASVGPFLYMLVVLLFIIALCWFILRLTGAVKRRGTTSGNLELKESIFVASQNMIQLVRAGDKYLVLGVSKERVTLLAELDEKQIKEAEETPPMGVTFGKVLERFLPPKDEANDGENKTDPE